MTAIGTGASARAMPSRTWSGTVPRCSARSAASWITGPSIIGSEKGMPTSTASAPAAITAASDCVQSSVMPPMR